jgi:hypothetical protein
MNAPNTPFVAYPLRFELQAIDPIYLHAHNGSALRGMVYRAALALTQGHARAADLDFIPDPALQRLLATLDESDPRGQDVPRPYVVDPPDHLPDTVRSTACRPTAKPETTSSAAPMPSCRCCAGVNGRASATTPSRATGFFARAVESGGQLVRRAITITPDLRQAVYGALTALIQAERYPDPPSDRWRCAACEFRRFCNDI